jgi:HK97 family phage major capsid protein
MEKITVNKMMVYSDISVEMLQDAAFNMRQEISSDVAEDFAQLEGNAFVNGDGVKKPEGLLSNADISSFNSGDAAALTADSLYGILGELKSGYDTTFMMNKRTLFNHVRTLKDGSGQYLFQLGAGTIPNTIAGESYVLASDMPDVGANAFPILVGDFRKAYYIVDSAEVTVLEDPYTQAISGVRRLFFYKRVAGQVVLGEALKKLKIAV